MARQRSYRTHSIVLKRMELGETDRLLTLFTRDHGKVRAVAKGVRRPRSRSAGHLELFTVADLLLAHGRNLDVVSQAEIITTFRRLREEIDLTTYAYYLVELVDLLTVERAENVEAFHLLVETFAALETDVDPRMVVIQFQLHLLHTLGYRPELERCLSCATAIHPGANCFSAQLGGVMCPRCGPSEPSARPVPDDPLKLLRHFQRTRGQFIVAAESVAQQAEALLRDYTEQLVERRLQAPALIARVREAMAGPRL